jgi:hypothetical protein
LYAALNDKAPEKFKNGFLDGTAWPVRPFNSFVLPLVGATKTGNEFDAMQILRSQSPLLTRDNLKGVNVAERLGDGNERALLWSGTAASAVDLQLDLPSADTWTSSTAYTIDAAGNVFGVATGTYNGVTGEFAAEWSPVDQASAITSSPREVFTTGANDAFAVTTSGSSTAALNELGALPTGMTFTDNGDGTATLAGTPAPDAVGKYSITFGASNGIGSPASQSFTLVVKQSLAPTFTSASTATFTAGAAGSLLVTTASVPSAMLTESGALPPDVAFVNNGNGTATLSGTAYESGGTYVLTLKAKNGTKPNSKQSLTLTVDQGPAIYSAATTTFTVGAAGKFTVTTTGFPTAAITEVGALPDGVTFVDKGNGNAKLRGTPAVGTDGSYPITIRAKNGVKPRASQSFTLVVNSSPIVAGANVLPAASALDTNAIADPAIDGIILSGAGDDTIAAL